MAIAARGEMWGIVCHSPAGSEKSNNSTPPRRICTPELVTFDCGKTACFAITVPSAQEVQHNRRTTQAARLAPCGPESKASTAAPANPRPRENKSDQRNGSLRKTKICSSAVEIGMVATSSEAIPDGTVFSAQKRPL